MQTSTSKCCTKCKIEKQLIEFGKCERCKDKLNYQCKECVASSRKQSYENNQESRTKTKERYQRWKMKNPSSYKNACKKAESNRDKEERRNYNKILRRNLRKNPVHRIRNNVSRQIIHALKRSHGSKRGESVLNKLDYTLEQLKEHLESQFNEKMNWDNYGSYWHIDHIYPQSLLPYESLNDDNFKKCWELKNLRPLEAIENMKKSNKLTS